MRKVINKFIGLMAVLTGVGCHTKPTASLSAPEQHFLEIRVQGKGVIYVDKVPNSRVLKQSMPDTAEQSHLFYSYAVSFVDSSVVVKEDESKNEKYFQYDMQNDWVLVKGGDSIRPCFFQPGVKLSKQKNDGILVFEVPAGQMPDSLLYLDSQGGWGQHLVLLNYSNNNTSL